MSEKCNISVVIPLYNHELYIESAINSVVCQSMKGFEIILIDDGSSDNGYALAKKLLSNFENTTLLSQKNSGAHVTLNRAIKLAKNEIIAILNSDDQFCPDKLLRCQKLFTSNHNVDMVFGKVEIINDFGKIQTEGVTIDWLQRSFSFLENYNDVELSLLNENFSTTTSNYVFRKSLWERIGGFANLRYCHDFDFIMRAYNIGAVLFDDLVHIKYRVHDKNTIAENLDLIRLEIATVIANALVDGALGSLLSDINEKNADGYIAMLKNKHMSDLLVLLLTVRMRFSNRTDYYDFMANSSIKEIMKKYSLSVVSQRLAE